jgi:adenylate cyclase
MAVEDQVVRAIVCTIAGQIERAETEVARARPIEDLTAYERVLFARHQLARATQADVLAAREILARVHAELPHFATACTWLAETYYYEAHSAWSTDPDGAARTAFELGRCAVELDDRDSLAHLVLAWGYFRVYRSIELASAQLALARAVNPNDYYGLCLASGLCLWDGDLDGAITHGLAALRRSPLTPDTCMRYFGLAHFCSERYEQALDAFSRMKSPGVDVLGAIAACYGLLGREEQAAQAAELFRARSLAGGGPLADPEAWHAYWTRVLPFRDRRYLDRLLDGLARAGLPGGPTSSAS